MVLSYINMSMCISKKSEFHVDMLGCISEKIDQNIVLTCNYSFLTNWHGCSLIIGIIILIDSSELVF